MKLPRGVSADRLIRALENLGYAVIRQKAAGVPPSTIILGLS
jgi:Holliday junction resolvase